MLPQMQLKHIPAAQRSHTIFWCLFVVTCRRRSAPTSATRGSARAASRTRRSLVRAFLTLAASDPRFVTLSGWRLWSTLAKSVSRCLFLFILMARFVALLTPLIVASVVAESLPESLAKDVTLVMNGAAHCPALHALANPAPSAYPDACHCLLLRCGYTILRAAPSLNQANCV
jgi:hypothetical protein